MVWHDSSKITQLVEGRVQSTQLRAGAKMRVIVRLLMTLAAPLCRAKRFAIAIIEPDFAIVLCRSTHLRSDLGGSDRRRRVNLTHCHADTCDD